MANIELVVKISEKDYKKVLDTNNREWDWNNIHSCYEAILDGAPLPKGHGRLIDADEIIHLINEIEAEDREEELYHLFLKTVLTDAPIIIKADTNS